MGYNFAGDLVSNQNFFCFVLFFSFIRFKMALDLNPLRKMAPSPFHLQFLKYSVRKELKTDRLKLMLKVMVLQVQKSF